MGIMKMEVIHALRAAALLGIALTGFGMEGDIRQSHEAGFKHHLVKPIDLNKLNAFIQEAAAALISKDDSLTSARVG